MTHVVSSGPFSRSSLAQGLTGDPIARQMGRRAKQEMQLLICSLDGRWLGRPRYGWLLSLRTWRKAPGPPGAWGPGQGPKRARQCQGGPSLLGLPFLKADSSTRRRVRKKEVAVRRDQGARPKHPRPRPCFWARACAGPGFLPAQQDTEGSGTGSGTVVPRLPLSCGLRNPSISGHGAITRRVTLTLGTP